MRVIATDPYVKKDDAAALGIEIVDLERLLRESDVVSIHTALTNETYHLIGERQLAMMKENAVIVNTARGKVIDQPALVDALRRKKIAGAGLDVLEKEPPDPDDPILKFDNVVLTPHIAFLSELSLVNLRTMVAEEAVRVLSGEAPKNPVNPAVLARKR